MVGSARFCVTPTTDSQSKLPAGLNLVDWKQIRAEYERHRHGMFPDVQGGVLRISYIRIMELVN